MEEMGVQDPYQYFYQEMDSWQVKKDAGKKELRKICSLWLEKAMQELQVGGGVSQPCWGGGSSDQASKQAPPPPKAASWNLHMLHFPFLYQEPSIVEAADQSPLSLEEPSFQPQLLGKCAGLHSLSAIHTGGLSPGFSPGSKNLSRFPGQEGRGHLRCSGQGSTAHT